MSSHSDDSDLDSSFELEMNLHCIRHTLLKMLDQYDSEECRRCEHFKSISGGPPPPRPTIDRWKAPDQFKPPPATELPLPDFKPSPESSEDSFKDIDAWVRASTPNPDKTVSPGCKPRMNSWPPAPSTVWNDYKEKISKPEINTGTVSQNSNVQEFFKSFNLNMYAIGAKDALARNRALMQQLKLMADKPAQYTYF